MQHTLNARRTKNAWIDLLLIVHTHDLGRLLCLYNTSLHRQYGLWFLFLFAASDALCGANFDCPQAAQTSYDPFDCGSDNLVYGVSVIWTDFGKPVYT